MIIAIVPEVGGVTNKNQLHISICLPHKTKSVVPEAASVKVEEKVSVVLEVVGALIEEPPHVGVLLP